MTKKRNKFRANMRSYVDCDYKKQLSPEDLEYLNKFEDEYYANGVSKKNSIHRDSLSPEDFNRCKKETFDATNAQNRDLYGISATSPNYLKFIDDENEYIEPASVKSSGISLLDDPQYAFKVFLEATVDEIESTGGRDLRAILVEYGRELVKLGASLRKDKVNSALKRRNQEKESE